MNSPSDEKYVSPYRRKMTQDEIDAKVLTVGEHAAMSKALVAAAAQRGGVILGTHDMMEAQPITKQDVLGGVQSSTIANAEPEAPKSRQVQRAEARRAEKRMRQHMNEHVGKKNRKH